MPTAARLVAGICLAVLGYLLSGIVMPLMPESTDFGYFVPVNIVLGLLAGWSVLGKRAGHGTTQAINNGFTGVLVLILWGIAVQAINEMIRRAMKNRYDDVFEALAAIFEIGAEFAYLIATLEFGITACIGAVISGLLTEITSRRWK